MTQARNELLSIDEKIAALEKRKAELRMFIELGARLFTANLNEAARPTGLQRTGNKFIFFGGPVQGPKPQTSTEVKARTFQSQKEMVLTKAKEIIALMGSMTTKELIEYIESTGQTIGGSDKTLTVSSILSRSEEFESDRVKGWSLKEGPKEKTPQDAATSAGSDLRVDQPELPIQGTGTTPERRGKEGSDDA